MLDQAGGQELVENGVGLFGKDGVDPVRAGGNWFAVRRYGDLKRHQ